MGTLRCIWILNKMNLGAVMRERMGRLKFLHKGKEVPHRSMTARLLSWKASCERSLAGKDYLPRTPSRTRKDMP